MKKNLATWGTALTLLVVLTVSAQVAAQDKQDRLHRTLGTGNNALDTQSQSSSMGGGGASNSTTGAFSRRWSTTRRELLLLIP